MSFNQPRHSRYLNELPIPGASVGAPLSPSETISPAIASLLTAARFPLFFKRAVASYIRWASTPPGRNDNYATVLECMHPQSVAQERELTLQLQDYRTRFVGAMRNQGIDFILTVPQSLPPMPKGGTATATLLAASYGFLYNIVRAFSRVGPRRFTLRLILFPLS